MLRRAVEAMPTTFRENRPPDYAPTLGAIVRAVQGAEKRLADIEGHPAIKVTPEQHGRAIERAATNIMREPMETFRNEAAASAERSAVTFSRLFLPISYVPMKLVLFSWIPPSHSISSIKLRH